MKTTKYQHTKQYLATCYEVIQVAMWTKIKFQRASLKQTKRQTVKGYSDTECSTLE